MIFRPLLILLLAMGSALAKTLLVLPLDGDLEKAQDLSTVNGLYRDVWQSLHQGDVHFPPDSLKVRCGEKSCALAHAQADKADEVVFSTVRRLGEKWIFTSTIIGANGSDAFSQRATALNVEDLDPVTHRVAEALNARLSLEKVATTENITGREENTEMARRRSLSSRGLSLGYLYPWGGTYATREYNDSGKLVDRQGKSALIRVALLHSWEFRDNLALDFDAVWALPNDIGGDLSMKYLFGKSDFTPFVGGGLGLHYVIPENSGSYGSRHRESGPTVLAQGGAIFFRTYDIHVIAKAQYQMIFNTEMDRGMSMDVGVIYQPKERRRGGGFITVMGYIFLGILSLGLLGAVSH